jgi:hypothetical protein
MAVSEPSATHENAVHAFLKSTQNMVGGDATRAHHAHHPNVRRVLQTTDPSQVSSGVCSPGTQEAQDLGLEPVVAHAEILSILKMLGRLSEKCVPNVIPAGFWRESSHTVIRSQRGPGFPPKACGNDEKHQTSPLPVSRLANQGSDLRQ